MLKVPDQFWQAALRIGQETGADVILLSAIAKHETNFGTLGAGRQGYALGYGVYSETNLDPLFKGLEKQLLYAGRQIANYLGYRAIGKTTWSDINSFAIDSWRAGDSAWQKGVWSWYQQILEGVDLVKVVFFFGPDDEVFAKRIANKLGAGIASRDLLDKLQGVDPVIVGGPAVDGALNITGEAWEDTADAAIKYLRG